MLNPAELTSYFHVRCYAHVLNLATQKALKIQAVERLFGRIRHVVTYFHKSPTAKHILEKKQKLV